MLLLTITDEFTAPDVPFLNASVIAQPLSMITGKASGANATDGFNILFLARGSGPFNNRTETPSGRYGFHLNISDVKEYLIVYRFPRQGRRPEFMKGSAR